VRVPCELKEVCLFGGDSSNCHETENLLWYIRLSHTVPYVMLSCVCKVWIDAEEYDENEEVESGA
jgi:hypothetical protein